MKTLGFYNIKQWDYLAAVDILVKHYDLNDGDWCTEWFRLYHLNDNDSYKLHTYGEREKKKLHACVMSCDVDVNKHVNFYDWIMENDYEKDLKYKSDCYKLGLL